MQFTIRASDGQSVRVESPNWMMAMGKAQALLDMDPAGMGRWVIETRPGGAVHVQDPVTGSSWDIEEFKSNIQVVASAASPKVEETPAPSPRRDDNFVAPTAPPPAFTMPSSRLSQPVAVPKTVLPTAPAAATTLSPQPAPQPAPPVVEEDEPESLAERLFDLSFDMMGASHKQAAVQALELILEFVPCEAASIVRGTINDPALTFLVASGPVGDKVIGRKIPFGQGIVGLCFDMKITLHVRDASKDERHESSVDRATGFESHEMLCCPIVDDMGRAFGVVELINPPEPFKLWHIETVETVARTLAGPLSAV